MNSPSDTVGTALKSIRTGALAILCLYPFMLLWANADFPRFTDWRQMEKEGMWTVATVTHIVPQDHGRCHFSYVVDGRQREGFGSCGADAVGDRFLLIYLPSNPEFFSSTPPRSLWLSPFFGFAFLSLIGGIVVGLLHFRHARRPPPPAPLIPPFVG